MALPVVLTAIVSSKKGAAWLQVVAVAAFISYLGQRSTFLKAD